MARPIATVLVALALLAVLATIVHRGNIANIAQSTSLGKQKALLSEAEKGPNGSRRLKAVSFDELFTDRQDKFYVHTSWANGVPRGNLVPDVWQKHVSWARTTPCTGVGAPGATLLPCGPFPGNNLHRTVSFKTGFFELFFGVDHASITIVADKKSIGPQGGSVWAALASTGQHCRGPADDSTTPLEYPVRVVRSGRYHAHVWIGGIDCGGGRGAVMEIRVWPDLFEVQLTLHGGSTEGVRIEGTVGGEGVNIHGAGTAKARFYLPAGGSAMQRQSEDPVTEVKVPTASSVDQQHHSWFVTLPNMYYSGAQGSDWHEVTLWNPNSEANTFRIIFNIDNPKGITGTAVTIHDDDPSKRPVGLLAQISKNWHADVEAPYSGAWYSAVVMLELPANGQKTFNLQFIHQYFNRLHSVSHAQLCLIGYGHNGFWDEVGLGINGESITYQHDRTMFHTIINDVRPFLVCGRRSDESQDCQGSPDHTQWTENHGGSDFLSAVDAQGSDQYFTYMSAHYNYNGPKLTNVSYHGVTADGAIEAIATVSTWTANDFTRHLHSFHYKVLKPVTYQRMTLYMMGVETYNAIKGSRTFAWGNAEGKFEETYIPQPGYSKRAPGYSKGTCRGTPPCWFALKTPEGSKLWGTNMHHAHRGISVRHFDAKIGGVDTPYAFSLIGIQQDAVGVEIRLNTPGHEVHLQAGDTISGDVEYMLYPSKPEYYIGTSDRFKNTLYQNKWYAATHQSASVTPLKQSGMRVGHLERAFPPRVRVDPDTQSAIFELEGFEGWSGTLPVSVSGLRSAVVDEGKFWYAVDAGSWTNLPKALTDVQVNRDIDGTFTFTIAVVPADQRFQPRAAGGNVQFAFQEDQPADWTSFPVPEDPADAAPPTVPIYEFWNEQTGDGEFSQRSTAFDASWSSQGVAFYAFKHEVEGSKPIYEYYNHATTDHEYTQRAFPWDNTWKRRFAIPFFAYHYQVLGSVPIYEYHSHQAHVYSHSAPKPSSREWKRGKVAFYAYAEQPESS